MFLNFMDIDTALIYLPTKSAALQSEDNHEDTKDTKEE